MSAHRYRLSLAAGTAAGAILVAAAGLAYARQQGPQKPPPPGHQGQQGQQQEQQQGQKPPEQPGQYSINVEVPLVNVDVVALTQSGGFITGLKKENFRVMEDGKPQQITNFSSGEAPITIVMVVEYSARFYGWFSYNATIWGSQFLRALRKDDWAALETFDMKNRVEVDFTQNKQEIEAFLERPFVPGFSESNLFDTIIDTLDRLQDVKGKKSILLLCTGVDTFSKHTLDQTLKRLRQTDVSIFAVSAATQFTVTDPNNGGIGMMQAENQLRSFAEMTGGNEWSPRFEGEMPEICNSIAAFLRNQYSLAYSPTNQARDGKVRKIKVELVKSDGSPFEISDQKGKKQKVILYARKEYTVPKGDVTLNIDPRNDARSAARQ